MGVPRRVTSAGTPKGASRSLFGAQQPPPHLGAVSGGGLEEEESLLACGEYAVRWGNCGPAGCCCVGLLTLRKKVQPSVAWHLSIATASFTSLVDLCCFTQRMPCSVVGSALQQGGAGSGQPDA